MSATIPNAERRIRDNIFTTSNINFQRRAFERELILTKWPDYSFLSSLEATQLFADRYVHHKRIAIRRHIDRDRADRVRNINLKSPMLDSRQLHQLWGARQKADWLGARYDDYLEINFEFATNVQRKLSGDTAN